jgi:hypothetical protein
MAFPLRGVLTASKAPSPPLNTLHSILLTVPFLDSLIKTPLDPLNMGSSFSTPALPYIPNNKPPQSSSLSNVTPRLMKYAVRSTNTSSIIGHGYARRRRPSFPPPKQMPSSKRSSTASRGSQNSSRRNSTESGGGLEMLEEGVQGMISSFYLLFTSSNNRSVVLCPAAGSSVVDLFE